MYFKKEKECIQKLFILFIKQMISVSMNAWNKYFNCYIIIHILDEIYDLNSLFSYLLEIKCSLFLIAN